MPEFEAAAVDGNKAPKRPGKRIHFRIASISGSAFPIAEPIFCLRVCGHTRYKVTSYEYTWSGSWSDPILTSALIGKRQRECGPQHTSRPHRERSPQILSFGAVSGQSSPHVSGLCGHTELLPSPPGSQTRNEALATSFEQQSSRGHHGPLTWCAYGSATGLSAWVFSQGLFAKFSRRGFRMVLRRVFHDCSSHAFSAGVPEGKTSWGDFEIYVGSPN